MTVPVGARAELRMLVLRLPTKTARKVSSSWSEMKEEDWRLDAASLITITSYGGMSPPLITHIVSSS